MQLNPLQERVVLLVQMKLDQVELLRFQMQLLCSEHRQSAMKVYDQAKRILAPSDGAQADENAAAKSYLAREAQHVLVVRRQDGSENALRNMATEAAHPTARRAAQDQLDKMKAARERWKKRNE